MPRIGRPILLRPLPQRRAISAREQLIRAIHCRLVLSHPIGLLVSRRAAGESRPIGASRLIKVPIDALDLDRGVELTAVRDSTHHRRRFKACTSATRLFGARAPPGSELNVQLSRLMEQLTVQLSRSPTSRAREGRPARQRRGLERSSRSCVLLCWSGGEATDTTTSIPAVDLHRGHHTISEDRCWCWRRFTVPRTNGSARSCSSPASFDASPVADRPQCRHLVRSRLAPDPPPARADPRRDRASDEDGARVQPHQPLAGFSTGRARPGQPRCTGTSPFVARKRRSDAREECRQKEKEKKKGRGFVQRLAPTTIATWAASGP